MAEDLMGDLECLNTSLQLRKQTVSGMLEAVDHVKTSMQDKRSEEHFDVLFSKATAVATKLDLQPIQMPHVRKPIKRYTVSITPFNVTVTEDPLRVHSFSNETNSRAAVIAVCITALYSVICVVGLLGNVLVMYGVVR
ncbi:hypothetical protein F7725_018670 [Dissostichus mawsoni]|uniref:Uncharacterized protein n=1 Tax=Dissostichus mawsoni TaxID=36200 RepID=A0A7J5XT16_DISMA|nr:hypothetical protein F7725_018670 [Dissostichus mawsoni]